MTRIESSGVLIKNVSVFARLVLPQNSLVTSGPARLLALLICVFASAESLRPWWMGAFCASLLIKVDFARIILATRRLLDSVPKHRLLAGHGKGCRGGAGGAKAVQGGVGGAGTVQATCTVCT